MERLRRLVDVKVSRRTALKAAVFTVGGAGVTYFGVESLINAIEHQDPYKGINLDEYLAGYISINLKGVNIRTAPKLDPKVLRINNPEGFIIKGTIPPGFVEVRVPNNPSPTRKAILGDIVEVNGVSVVENRHNLITERKSDLITPVIIQNPGIVKGDNPDNPTAPSGRWIALSTSIRIPDEDHTDYPTTTWYWVIKKVFYVNIGPQTAEFVKHSDEKGKPLSKPPNLSDILVPLVTVPDGSHFTKADNQPVRFFGRVILPQRD